jgi:hypothetical protein
MRQVSFEPLEREIWEKLGAIAGQFKSLPPTHPSDLKDAADAIHVLQDILGRRVLRREFPGSFATYRPQPNGTWTQDEGKQNG